MHKKQLTTWGVISNLLLFT